MQTREQDIRRYLVSAIEAGQFPEGSRLPTERALCESLSASRSAVRSALAVLEGEGRIYRVAGSGTFVREAGGAARGGFGIESSPAQIMEARLTLEPPMAALICANATSADLAELGRCVQAGAEAADLPGFEGWDGTLHRLIAEATKNPLVVASYALVTRARDSAEWGDLKRRSLTPERRLVYQGDHERIVEALARRDARVAEAEIRGHLLRVRDNLLAP